MSESIEIVVEHTEDCPADRGDCTCGGYVSVAEVERLLREVSSDFAGAHVNAGVVIGSVRKRLRAALEAPDER